MDQEQTPRWEQLERDNAFTHFTKTDTRAETTPGLARFQRMSHQLGWRVRADLERTGGRKKGDFRQDMLIRKYKNFLEQENLALRQHLGEAPRTNRSTSALYLDALQAELAQTRQNISNNTLTYQQRIGASISGYGRMTNIAQRWFNGEVSQAVRQLDAGDKDTVRRARDSLAQVPPSSPLERMVSTMASWIYGKTKPVANMVGNVSVGVGAGTAVGLGTANPSLGVTAGIAATGLYDKYGKKKAPMSRTEFDKAVDEARKKERRASSKAFLKKFAQGAAEVAVGIGTGAAAGAVTGNPSIGITAGMAAADMFDRFGKKKTTTTKPPPPKEDGQPAKPPKPPPPEAPNFRNETIGRNETDSGRNVTKFRNDTLLRNETIINDIGTPPPEMEGETATPDPPPVPEEEETFAETAGRQAGLSGQPPGSRATWPEGPVWGSSLAPRPEKRLTSWPARSRARNHAIANRTKVLRQPRHATQRNSGCVRAFVRRLWRWACPTLWRSRWVTTSRARPSP